MEFFESISRFGEEQMEFKLIIYNLVQLIIAFILAMPVAWNREYSTRSAGLRTFPLVSIASCAYMLMGIAAFSASGAQARVAYGIITGMGFIGGGAILKARGNVIGTATAASLWNTGAIGMCVAHELYEIALLLSIINFLILQFVVPLKQKKSEKKEFEKVEEDSDKGQV